MYNLYSATGSSILVYPPDYLDICNTSLLASLCPSFPLAQPYAVLISVGNMPRGYLSSSHSPHSLPPVSNPFGIFPPIMINEVKDIFVQYKLNPS